MHLALLLKALLRVSDAASAWLPSRNLLFLGKYCAALLPRPAAFAQD